MANILVVYGSLTGNTQLVAENISQKLSQGGHDVVLKNANEATAQDLLATEILVMGASTWDDGLLQYDFADFLANLENETLDLSGKKLAIFGCGDSNYEHFCEATTIIEKALTAMKAEKIGEALKIDGFPQLEENTERAEQWIKNLLDLLK